MGFNPQQGDVLTQHQHQKKNNNNKQLLANITKGPTYPSL